MALASMIKDFVHHVPSFNDLNTMPEEPLVGMHSENSGSLDQKLAADQNAQPTMERAPSKKMTNKKSDEPAVQIIDYHEFDKHRSTTGTQRHHIFDNPRPIDAGKVPSVWEMIMKSEEYMKGERDQAKSTNILENTESRGGSTQAPLGLNSRAVPNDNPELMSKTAPEAVRQRAEERKEAHAAAAADAPAGPVEDRKVAGIKDMLEHYGSD